MYLKKEKKTYSICDLFNWFDIITRNQFVVSIEKFNAGLFESTLSQKETLDTRKTYSRNPLDKSENIEENCRHSWGLSYACSISASSSLCD